MSSEYLLIDGYNIIFAWPELKELAETNMDSARTKLQDILCNYQGYKKCNVILVFDGYKVKGNPGTVIKYHNIHVIFTKEAETADQYIEKVSQQIGRQYQVRVATSDKLEQIIILGTGGTRLSARDLKKEIEETNTEIKKEHLENPGCLLWATCWDRSLRRPSLPLTTGSLSFCLAPLASA